MAKNSVDAYGASGKTNVLMFEPEKLHLVTDKTHPLYDERINLPIDEGMVLNIKELGVLEPITVWKDPENGLTCVVVGRQRVRHTMEANKLLLKEGKTSLLVPGVVKRGLYKSTGNRNKHPKPITTLVDEALRKLETPATDRIVAAQRSAFVDEAVSKITESGALTLGDCIVALCQLREGASE